MEQPKFVELVEKYLSERNMRWSDVTRKTERPRLLSLPVEVLFDSEDPGTKLYEYLLNERKLKPYTIKTSMIRAGDFIEWAMEAGHIPLSFNHIKLFMKHKARLFKGVYTPKRNGLTFEEAKARIGRIRDEESRAKAFQLLKTGMRWDESSTLKDGYVTGKGNKQRHVPTATKEDELPPYSKTYTTFNNHLKGVGLNAHALRKAFATFLAENKAHEGDLMKIMGWSSSITASSYLQATRERELAAKVNKAMKQPGGRKKNGK